MDTLNILPYSSLFSFNLLQFLVHKKYSFVAMHPFSSVNEIPYFMVPPPDL